MRLARGSCGAGAFLGRKSRDMAGHVHSGVLPRFFNPLTAGAPNHVSRLFWSTAWWWKHVCLPGRDITSPKCLIKAVLPVYISINFKLFENSQEQNHEGKILGEEPDFPGQRRGRLAT